MGELFGSRHGHSLQLYASGVSQEREPFGMSDDRSAPCRGRPVFMVWRLGFRAGIHHLAEELWRLTVPVGRALSSAVDLEAERESLVAAGDVPAATDHALRGQGRDMMGCVLMTRGRSVAVRVVTGRCLSPGRWHRGGHDRENQSGYHDDASHRFTSSDLRAASNRYFDGRRTSVHSAFRNVSGGWRPRCTRMVANLEREEEAIAVIARGVLIRGVR